MQQSDRRAEPRVPKSFGGTLAYDGTSIPCDIQNMCSRGFLIKHSKELPVGRVLRLKCELYPGQSVECTVQIRHVNAQYLGAIVTEISDAGRILCQRYLEEQHAASSKSV
jgi:hypothetical protein